MKPIDEIEKQRQRNKKDNKPIHNYTILMSIVSMINTYFS